MYLCNCQNSVFVYLTWPLRACSNGILMQTYNKNDWILFSRINSLHYSMTRQGVPAKVNVTLIPNPPFNFSKYNLFNCTLHSLCLMVLTSVSVSNKFHFTCSWSLKYVWRVILCLTVMQQITVHICQCWKKCKISAKMISWIIDLYIKQQIKLYRKKMPHKVLICANFLFIVKCVGCWLNETAHLKIKEVNTPVHTRI